MNLFYLIELTQRGEVMYTADRVSKEVEWFSQVSDFFNKTSGLAMMDMSRFKTKVFFP